MSVTELENKIAALSKEAEQIARDNDHKLAYSNPASREAQRLRAHVEFANAGFDVSDARPGIVVLDGKFEASLRSKKWRRVGRQQWYRYRSAKDLYEKLHAQP
ncbi:hypothetical protein [Nitratireductor indicus]|uniref:hypothetical protein n=1 Tax=Nitratireductor indicus TaxID=721133 RepID=UPI002875CF67|nr:hypothetical protein [Nitratireductor indicus]MDS1138567.1 hypothetical protein [Nitratireductor indicus]